MTPRTTLIVSLCLNAILISLLAYASRFSSPAPSPLPEPKTAPRQEINTKPAKPTAEVAAPSQIVRLDWRSVESPDFKDYILKLRSIDCPEETIRDIIIADVNKLFATRWKNSMAPTNEPLKYWLPWDSSAEYNNSKMIAQKRALERDKKALIKELLDVDYDKEMRNYEISFTWLDRENRLYEFLPEPKRSQIIDIHNRTRELSQQISERAKNGELTKEDQAELARLRASEVTEMKKLMTPDEFEGYKLRISATANVLRSQLVGFNPTEQEFISLFRAQSAFNDQTKQMDPQDPDFQKKRLEAAQEMENKAKQTLGEQRYAEYQRAKDYEYRELIQITQQQELPDNIAVKVYNITKAAQQQSARLRQDPNLADEQRQAALAAIQAETQKAIQQNLGDDAYKQYQRTRSYQVQTLRR